MINYQDLLIFKFSQLKTKLISFNIKLVVFQSLFFILIFQFCFQESALAQSNLNSASDYVKIVKHYRYLKPDSALFYVKEGIAKADEAHDELGKADLLNQYGMIQENSTDLDKALEKYLEAEIIYRKLNNQKGLSTVWIRLASVERKKGNSRKSLSFIMKALKFSETNNDNAGKLEARVAFAQTYFELKDYNRAIANLRLAENIDKQIPLSNMTFDMYIYIGSIYNKLNKPDSAIVYVKKGLSKSIEPEYNGFRGTLLQTLGISYHLQGDVKLALEALNQSLTIAKMINNLPRQQTTLIEIANVYKNQNPDTALFYLEKALVIAKKLKKNTQTIVILNKISEIYKIKGDFEKALSFIEKSYQLSDEVYYKDMSKQILNLEAANALSKSKVKMAELELFSNKEKTEKNIILAIAIAISLLLVITFVYYSNASNLNKMLRQANEKLAESNLEKDKFFSILAHDIRSPLASTVSVLKFIANRELDDKTQDEVVGKLALHCESSLDILDKLLKWGQMQIKGANLNITEFHPIHNINANMAVLIEAADNKNILIDLVVDENIIIKADSDHFDFVVRNLLANAIKFTPINGMIKLEAESKNEGSISFSVADNGVGISENRIKNIFKLSAVGTKGTSDEQGTSLGLLICKEFIEANKGTLTLESELNNGTTFNFILPGFVKANLV